MSQLVTPSSSDETECGYIEREPMQTLTPKNREIMSLAYEYFMYNKRGLNEREKTSLVYSYQPLHIDFKLIWNIFICFAS